MEETLKIFYEEIIKEASLGQVDCGLIYNIVFESIVEKETIKENVQVSDKSKLLIPTLIIKNKNLFNEILLKYVTLAESFYDANYYTLVSKENNQDVIHNYKKAIMTLLWSDATSEDYANPVLYIKRKIDFLKNKTLENSQDPIQTSLGELTYQIKKEPLFEETPYSIEFSINNELLPVVRYGVSDEKAYIYAIQNTSKKKLSNKLNRSLYKTEEGLTEDKEINDNINYPENLRGVTPSTLVSAALALALLKSKGISEFVIPAILPTRWNAKEIYYQKKVSKLKSLSKSSEEINDFLKTSEETHESIQRNLSDKFLRTFRRLDYHFENIEITSIPMINDINMHLIIDDEIVNCNNPLLQELFEQIKTHQKLNK